MTTELQTVNISKGIIERIGDQYDPVFSQIRIYGDIKYPLFVAKDVEKVLKLSDLHIRDKPDFKEGFHYKYMPIDTIKGQREAIVLTEMGLNKAMFMSTIPIAEQYCLFITVAFRELRTEGIVTMETAIGEYQKEKKQLEYELKRLDNTTDMLKSELDESKMLQSQHFASNCKLAQTVEDLELKISDIEATPDILEQIEYIDTLEKSLFKQVNIYIMDDDLGDDDFDIQDSDVYSLKLSLKKLTRGVFAGTVGMYQPSTEIATLGAEQDSSIEDLRANVKALNIKVMKQCLKEAKL